MPYQDRGRTDDERKQRAAVDHWRRKNAKTLVVRKLSPDELEALRRK